MNRKINVYLMYAIIFLQGFVFYGPISTLYRQARGLSMYDIFVIESISWIMMILFEVPWGWFADRFGYKKTIIISNTVFFVSKIVFFRAYSFPMFLLERALLALALAGLSGCDMALLYSSIDGKDSEKVFGRYHAFSTGGLFIASLFSTLIIGKSMDQATFLTIIPYGMAVTVSLFLQDIRVNHKEKPKLRSSFRMALKNKHLILLVFSVALAREVVQSVTVFLNQSQYLRSGIDIKYFGLLLALVQLVRLSSAKAYRLSHKLGKDKSILILYLGIMVSCSILIFTANPIITILCIIIISMSMALIEPVTMDIQNKSIETGDRATILSVYAMLGDVCAAVVNPIIGRAADISIAASFFVCVLICIVMVSLFLFYFRKQNQEKRYVDDGGRECLRAVSQ